MSFSIQRSTDNQRSNRIDINNTHFEFAKGVKTYGKFFGKIAVIMKLAQKINCNDEFGDCSHESYYVNIRSLGKARIKQSGNEIFTMTKLIDRINECFTNRVAKYKVGNEAIELIKSYKTLEDSRDENYLEENDLY